jgi:membrane protease YdiL (CAAX protease family)
MFADENSHLPAGYSNRSTPANETERRHNDMRRPATFFVFACAFTWTILGLDIAAEQGVLAVHLPSVLLTLAGFGPAIAALMMAFTENGQKGAANLLGRLLRIKMRPHWYMIVLLGPAVTVLAALGINALLGGSANLSAPPILEQVGSQTTYPWLFIPVVFLTQLLTVGEELGWRGYLLLQLQDMMGSTSAALLIGILWGVWHLPMIFTPAARSAVSDIPLILFFADIVALSVIYTWVFNHTEGSVFMTTLLHAANNSTSFFLPFLPTVTGGTRVFVILVILHWLLALAVLGFSKWSYRASLASRQSIQAFTPKRSGKLTN